VLLLSTVHMPPFCITAFLRSQIPVFDAQAAAAQSALFHPPQQSKSTSTCSETTPDSDAPAELSETNESILPPSVSPRLRGSARDYPPPSPLPVSTEGALWNPSQQSKSPSNCPEIIPASAGPNSAPETRNWKPSVATAAVQLGVQNSECGTVSHGANQSARLHPSQQSKSTTNCSETIPTHAPSSSELSTPKLGVAPASATAPRKTLNSDLGTGSRALSESALLHPSNRVNLRQTVPKLSRPRPRKVEQLVAA